MNIISANRLTITSEPGAGSPATSRRSRPTFSSCLQCLWCSGVFLTGCKERKGRILLLAASAQITGHSDLLFDFGERETSRLN